MPLGPETRAVSVDAPLISGVTAADVAATGRMPSERVATGVALLRTLMRAQSSLLSEISERVLHTRRIGTDVTQQTFYERREARECAGSD